jgi:hypothetical protein
MRITVRGWGRDLGETEIMDHSLEDAVAPEGNYQRGKLYKKVQNPDNRRRTSMRISTGTEVRLGGMYLMHVELSRKEIAQLFFETHNGTMVRMMKAYIEEEEAEDRAAMLQSMAQMAERRQKRLAETEPDSAP